MIKRAGYRARNDSFLATAPLKKKPMEKAIKKDELFFGSIVLGIPERLVEPGIGHNHFGS